VSTVILESVQFASLTDVDDVAPISDKDHDVLEEVRDVLRKHGVTDRFGICLLHRHFDLAEDEILMESTDVTARRSVLEVMPKLDHDVRTLPTQWRFSMRGDVDADTECRKACHYDSGHKTVHIKVGV
jgi:hypothetical protein